MSIAANDLPLPRPFDRLPHPTRDLVVPTWHTAHIRRHRAGIIAERVRLVAAAFAILTPAWAVVDWAVFDWPLWALLMVLRGLAAIGFAALAIPQWNTRSLTTAYAMLAALLAIPTLFYALSDPFLTQAAAQDTVLAAIVANSYAWLPLVVIAGLTVFPLTMVEVALVVAVELAVTMLCTVFPGPASSATLVQAAWLLLLVGGIAVVAGMSQLHYMVALIHQAHLDALTGACTRRSGEETLDLQFRIASRTAAKLAVAFLDVDDFKSVNDTFGHEEGDRTLQGVAEALRQSLRRSDVLIRWGGEEFLILLPNTDAAAALNVVARIRNLGLGTRPDGRPVTASIGLAERTSDGAEDWPILIDLADVRMYKAKTAGKNCCYTVGDRKVA